MKTSSMRFLGKTAYVGHRRFLKKPHKWRRSLEFNGETENGDPPIEFNWDAIMTQLARLPTRVKVKHLRFGGVKIKRNVLVELNWTKQSIFYELEYWSFLTLKHNLDVTHIEKNVLESILNTLLMNDKSKDTAKARQDLKSLGIRSGLWLGQNKNGNPEIDTYRAKFKSEFPDNDMKEAFPGWFGKQIRQRHVDNDPGVSESSELFALAYGPSQTPISVNSCVVNGVRYGHPKTQFGWQESGQAAYPPGDPEPRIAFWNDPKNRARATQNKQNRAKSKVMESSATREYPSLIHTFFLIHTVNGVFLNPEDKALYEEMLRLQGLAPTRMGLPYIEDEINAIVRVASKRAHSRCWSDDKFSQMLTQLESQPEIGGGSGSGGRGDDEQGDDEDDGEDGEDEDDS
ncbi:zinc finger, PHD-type containing protein [Tanacetum coccineum]